MASNSSNTQPPSSLQAESKLIANGSDVLKNMKPASNGDHVLKKIKPEHGVGLRWWRRMRIKDIDWRRVAHSAKVGLALALVSLSVLLQDVFDKLGHNALWAILTVVVIFEYTVGATLSKGLNRGLGTIMAASLGLFVDYMANFTGAKAEPFVVGFSVFLIGMTATYTRFVPSIKAKYDYGVVIFLLTFCLVVISGYRVSDNIDVVFDRIVTVMVGVIVCLLISIFIFPIWAGDDLHKLVIQNFEGLANSLEECLKEYFQGVQKLSRVSSKICKGQPYDDKIYKGYRGVLISKQTEESLATFASWEPRRGWFGCMYPWKRLVEVGAILRHCAYTVSALHGCVLSEIQAPESLRKVFAASCIRIGEEVAGVLRGVASDMKAKQKTKPKKILLYNVHLTIEGLNHAVRTYPHFIYASRLQNPNLNYNNSIPIPNPNTINYTPCLQETTQSPFISHDLQPHSCLSPNPTRNQSFDLSSFPSPPLHHVCHSNLNSHVIQIPTSSSHANLGASPLPPNPNPYPHPNPISNSNPCIDIGAYPPPPNPNPNPNPISNSNPCIDIEVPTSDHISTSHLNFIFNSHPNSNFPGDKESIPPNSLPPTNSKGDNKVCFMLHESMEFAESLSLASLITLLIEFVARVEHVLDAIVEFQDQAGFREVGHDKENPTCNHILNHPISTSHVE